MHGKHLLRLLARRTLTKLPAKGDVADPGGRQTRLDALVDQITLELCKAGHDGVHELATGWCVAVHDVGGRNLKSGVHVRGDTSPLAVLQLAAGEAKSATVCVYVKLFKPHVAGRPAGQRCAPECRNR